MQQKRYANADEVTIASGGSTTLLITNNELNRMNVHGIRYKGRLRADNVSADNEAHGFIILMAHPASYTFAASDFTNNTELEDASDWIIAVEPWSIFGGSTNPVGFGTFYDWEMVINSSRTLRKDAILRAVVLSQTGSAKSVIVTNHLLSCFGTQAKL